MKDRLGVTAALMGGLGNFMFQVAAAYAYAKRYDRDVGFSAQQARGPHQDAWEYQENIFKDVDLVDFKIGKGGDIRQVQEDGFHYNEIPEYLNRDVCLVGYFQSEKYFKDFENEVRELFMSYDVELSDETKDLLENYNTCSIHVRRGDFLKHPNHHPTQGMNYFLKATKKMPKDSMFLIFSDDIAWCKENFPDLPEKFRFIEGNKDYEDLYIMSKCNNNIICNSTFSWWGAWLNSNLDKIVVAPEKWFGPAYANWDTSDLYCENWIKI
jgi:hypothetical protein